ncbi:uncharacterized protein LOC126819171 isoform X2 [Patella vulgata]|uniref:uncharacterized protein LOC126819171 isoform X2 n=1 Tax=Patella vulgata TaxID=6465 RepID=UPI00217FE578|nr:uncharacterized protein LOC126819171 isoform X2 [Patella vulgata]
MFQLQTYGVKNNGLSPEKRSYSLSALDEGTRRIHQKNGKFNIFLCLKSNIRKDHWDSDIHHPICYGCQRPFKVLFRRHHCRRCGKVYCYHCSGYKMRLDDDAEISSEGRPHRVCYNCKRSHKVVATDDASDGKTTRWSKQFQFLREEAHVSNSALKKEYPSNMFQTEVLQMCEPVVDVFIKSNRKDPKKKNIIVDAVGGAIKASGRESWCGNCDKSLMNPQNRKECSLCKESFCKKCTSKDLVIYSSDNSDLKVAITDDFTGFQKRFSSSKLFRTCLRCKANVKVIYDEAIFNEKLHDAHCSLSHLQFKISEALEQIYDGMVRRTLAETPSLEITEYRESSFNSKEIEFADFVFVEDDKDAGDFRLSRTKDEIKAQGCDISKDLIDSYYNEFQKLVQLKPQTEIQKRLFYNVKVAMRDYYINTNSRIKHFSN